MAATDQDPATEPLRRVFITGLARSGTTLLANLLNAQPQAKVWSDALQAPFIMAERSGGFARPLGPRERNVALSWLDFQLQGTPHRTALRADDFATVGELYQRVLEEVAGPTIKIVGHKINGFGPGTRVFGELLAQTDVRCICVLRDVRDVVLSQRNHIHGKATATDRWTRWAREAFALRDHPRVVVVRYEDLVTSPAAALEPIERLLGIRVALDLSELRHIDQPWVENSAFHDVQRLFDPRPAGRWREHLADPAVREAAWRNASALATWDYPPFPEAFRRRERLRFARHELAQLARTARRRVRRVLGRQAGE